jgi:hypothetical protein
MNRWRAARGSCCSEHSRSSRRWGGAQGRQLATRSIRNPSLPANVPKLAARRDRERRAAPLLPVAVEASEPAAPVVAAAWGEMEREERRRVPAARRRAREEPAAPRARAVVRPPMAARVRAEQQAPEVDSRTRARIPLRLRRRMREAREASVAAPAPAVRPASAVVRLEAAAAPVARAAPRVLAARLATAEPRAPEADRPMAGQLTLVRRYPTLAAVVMPALAAWAAPLAQALAARAALEAAPARAASEAARGRAGSGVSRVAVADLTRRPTPGHLRTRAMPVRAPAFRRSRETRVPRSVNTAFTRVARWFALALPSTCGSASIIESRARRVRLLVSACGSAAVKRLLFGLAQKMLTLSMDRWHTNAGCCCSAPSCCPSSLDHAASIRSPSHRSRRVAQGDSAGQRAPVARRQVRREEQVALAWVAGAAWVATAPAARVSVGRLVAAQPERAAAPGRAE